MTRSQEPLPHLGLKLVSLPASAYDECMPLKLDTHDQLLVAVVRKAMMEAIANAHTPVAVAKRISVVATAQRNLGRAAARKRHPFNEICEASGLPLDERHAELDALDPDLGYTGKVRWVCSRANHSGKHSCGGCE